MKKNKKNFKIIKKFPKKIIKIGKKTKQVEKFQK
jgi:hypothetical protein